MGDFEKYYKIINHKTKELECYVKINAPIRSEKLCELIGFEGCYAEEITEEEYYENTEKSE